MTARVRASVAGVLVVALLGGCATSEELDRPTGVASGAQTPHPERSGSAPTSATSPAASGGPVSSHPASGTWTRLEGGGERPPAREDHTWTVADGGRIAYLFGGRDGATVFDDVWAFDLDDGTWRRLRVEGEIPAARFGHEAVWIPGRGLAIWAGQAGTTFFNDVWLFQPGSGWERLRAGGDVPVARYGSCSGVGPDGALWVSHGFTANGVRFDDTRSFDLQESRWTDRTPGRGRPIERCLHACWWTSDGRLALYGGQTNGVAALGDLWFLTPGAPGGGAGAWAESSAQEAPARKLAAVARRDDVTVVVGGRGTDGEPLADAWLLPDGAAALMPLDAPDPPPARSGAAMIYDAAGDRFVLFGGEGDRAFGDAWELSLR